METTVKKTQKENKREPLKEHFTLCSHPLISQNVAILRNKDTQSEEFRAAAAQISRIMLCKATENLPVVKTVVETPLSNAEVNIISPHAKIIFAPILRAGLVLSEAVAEMIPQAGTYHIGLYRDEKTLKPVSYYNHLPKQMENPEKTYVYILDPMLATGGSACAAVQIFTKLNIPEENIFFLSIIASPEGLRRVRSEYSRVNILTASLDSGLNKSGYIIPGLGDAGDRSFNT